MSKYGFFLLPGFFYDLYFSEDRSLVELWVLAREAVVVIAPFAFLARALWLLLGFLPLRRLCIRLCISVPIWRFFFTSWKLHTTLKRHSHTSSANKSPGPNSSPSSFWPSSSLPLLISFLISYLLTFVLKRTPERPPFIISENMSSSSEPYSKN